jgi:hypothetical protein
MGQVRDNNGNIINNTFTPLGSPIVLATGTASNAFLLNTPVDIIARTAECFYIVGTGSLTAATSDNSLPVGASRQIMIPQGSKIAVTGGELRVTVMGSIDEIRSKYYV